MADHASGRSTRGPLVSKARGGQRRTTTHGAGTVSIARRRRSGSSRSTNEAVVLLTLEPPSPAVRRLMVDGGGGFDASPPPGGSSRQHRRAQQDEQRQAKALRAMTAAAAELLLVRHGETDWNSEARLQGQSLPGPGLNNVGRQQAATVAGFFSQPGRPPVHAVYSSDLDRAVQTAEAVATALGHPVLTSPGLRERHLGMLQGYTHAEAAASHPAAYRALVSPDPDQPVPGGGESIGELQRRVVGELGAVAARHPGQRVVTVSHGGALQAVYRHVMGRRYAGKILNGSIGVVVVEGDRWALRSWNGVEHLSAAGLDRQGGFGGGAGEG